MLSIKEFEDKSNASELLTAAEREALRVARANVALTADVLATAREQRAPALPLAKARDAAYIARREFETLRKSLRDAARERMLPPELRAS
ncbi:MAG: hypothetical protein ACRD2Z_09645 [Thermoanaerobaculia bacterium]